ncbi:hypothetical protein BS47DRAFT_1369739 [Hydnum rufescens UP504]|uniref:Uncharacterized protein n=1 Tax=Hydnum rufescens UP504 TaxID=1448309 RepID=A0A9P6DLL2_9AGAM|nr:hypothetical protein BS47DRAFT_1369739 [Hydnum rufescens UP504]
MGIPNIVIIFKWAVTAGKWQCCPFAWHDRTTHPLQQIVIWAHDEVPPSNETYECNLPEPQPNPHSAHQTKPMTQDYRTCRRNYTPTSAGCYLNPQRTPAKLKATHHWPTRQNPGPA